MKNIPSFKKAVLATFIKIDIKSLKKICYKPCTISIDAYYSSGIGSKLEWVARSCKLVVEDELTEQNERVKNYHIML